MKAIVQEVFLALFYSFPEVYEPKHKVCALLNAGGL